MRCQNKPAGFGEGAFQWDGLLLTLNGIAICLAGEAVMLSSSLGLPCFTDKMPANFSHVGLISMILPNAKIIDARRHPMGTCVANYRQLYAQGKNQTYDLVDFAEYFLEYIRIMDHWQEVLPGRVLRAQYEDVVSVNNPVNLEI